MKPGTALGLAGLGVGLVALGFGAPPFGKETHWLTATFWIWTAVVLFILGVVVCVLALVSWIEHLRGQRRAAAVDALQTTRDGERVERDARIKRASLRAAQQTVESDLKTANYQLFVADKYSDELRFADLQATVARLNAEWQEIQAQIDDLGSADR